MSVKATKIIDNIISLKFNDVEIPEMKPDRFGGYVKYGAKNDFPEMILRLFKKSSKHNAIVGGKACYIYGGGLKEAKTPEAQKFARAIDGDKSKSKKKLQPPLTKKIALDLELYGGVAIQAIPTYGGWYKFVHISFHKIRTNRANTKFFFKHDWTKANETAKELPAFEPGTKEPSLIYFKEYTPGNEPYPIPGYHACLNFIKADVEVSRHTLSNAESGFSASKFINFFNGEPDDEGKKSIEERFKNKFGGSAGDKIIIAFNETGSTAPTVVDLGTSDLTKEDFSQVDNLICSNIFSGHQVTSPELFGIVTPGKLGGTQTMREAYEIFTKTYIRGKQEQVEDIINFLASANGIEEEFEFISVEPVGVVITDATAQLNMTRKEIRERLSLPEEAETVVGAGDKIVKALNALSPLVATKVLETMTPNEIRAMAGLPPETNGDVRPVAPGTVTPVTDGQETELPAATNELLTGLKGSQNTQLLRVLRQYNKQVITREMAVIMLQPFGFTEVQINTLLGVPATPVTPAQPAQFRMFFQAQLDKDFLEQLACDSFEECGIGRSEFSIMSTTGNVTAIDGEVESRSFFAVASQVQILSVLSKKPNATVEEIAQELSLPESVVKADIDTMISSGTLQGESGAYAILKKATVDLPAKIETVLPKLQIVYSYEVLPGVGAEIKATTRPFCKKMCELDRFYTRTEIEKISLKLGYNVFDRRGGFWNKGDGETSPSCRHYWAMHVVIKK